jgi:hypothetical protein
MYTYSNLAVGLGKHTHTHEKCVFKIVQEFSDSMNNFATNVYVFSFSCGIGNFALKLLVNGFSLCQLICILKAYESKGLLFFSSSAKFPDPSSESSHGNNIIISLVLHLLRQTQEVLQYNLTVWSETHLLFMSPGCESGTRLPRKWDKMHPAS